MWTVWASGTADKDGVGRQDRVGWSRVVCGLCSTMSDKARVKSARCARVHLNMLVNFSCILNVFSSGCL